MQDLGSEIVVLVNTLHITLHIRHTASYFKANLRVDRDRRHVLWNHTVHAFNTLYK